MQNWIHIKDKLPDIKKEDEADIEYEDVLVVNRDGQMYVAYLQKWGVSGYRTEEKYVWSDRSTGCGCCAQGLDPTHWMALPKPPTPWYETDEGRQNVLDAINEKYKFDSEGNITEK